MELQYSFRELNTAGNGGMPSIIVLKNEYILARYEVLAAVFLKIQIFRYVTMSTVK
jgi:hypothetical protein